VDLLLLWYVYLFYFIFIILFFIIIQVWEGLNVISVGRKMLGATDPAKSEPGTVRGDYAIVTGR
jgi:nucleoside diphosphate kinase